MKLKHIGILVTAMAAATACDDNTGSLGIGMLDDNDYLTAAVATFDVKTESFFADSVFAKTSIGYVGKFSDPEFGSFEASFLTELNNTEYFMIPEVYRETEFDSNGKATKGEGLLYKDSVVAARLVVYYDEWFGDSLNTCRMSAYELSRPLDNNRYTNIDPEDYYDKNDATKLLGRKAYSAYDTSVPDSVRTATDDNGNRTYYPNLYFTLDSLEFGYKRILKEYRDNPWKFKDASTFRDNVFKGVYLKNDLGDGTILYIDRVDLQLEFCCRYTDEETGVALKKTDGTDSLYNTTQILFASTKEVTQANRFENTALLKQKVEEKEWTYIKSPAGIFTQATLPYDEIYEQLTGDTLNAVRLTFTNYRQQSDYEFSMDVPEDVLLIRKKDLKTFFEENELPDNITSFTVSHNNVNVNQYTFQNIARLVTTCINEKQAAKTAAGASWDEEKWMKENKDWDKVLLIPVTLTIDDSNSSYTGTTQIIGLQHDLKPGYAKLIGGPATVDNTEDGQLKNPLKLEVIHTSFVQKD